MKLSRSTNPLALDPPATEVRAKLTRESLIEFVPLFPARLWTPFWMRPADVLAAIAGLDLRQSEHTVQIGRRRLTLSTEEVGELLDLLPR